MSVAAAKFRAGISDYLTGGDLDVLKDRSSVVVREITGGELLIGDADTSEIVRRVGYRPKTVGMLLSSRELERHGLRTFDDQEAASWIIPIDADDLVNPPPSSNWHAQLIARIDELRQLAAEEGVPFSEASAGQASIFARDIAAMARPGAFLVGNGNIRLLWSDGDEQIGLQFRGAENVVQYVMFVRRGAQITTHMGTDDSDTIMRLISALGLRHLLRA